MASYTSMTLALFIYSSPSLVMLLTVVDKLFREPVLLTLESIIVSFPLLVNF